LALASKATSSVDDTEEDDPVIALIERTGCLDEHNAIMECMFDNKDWRKCQTQVKNFRHCMSKEKPPE
uniref:CHCH domain-containing protein n=1 Tax=Schistocephalus solidus TaxID=70667 RepID=A0A183TMX9_SCHSO